MGASWNFPLDGNRSFRHPVTFFDRIVRTVLSIRKEQLFGQNVIVHTKSSLPMGCLFGKSKSSDRRRLQSNLVYEPASYTSAGPELSVLGDAELGQILNEIHLCPFPESRAEILKSRLGMRLITRSDLLQILKLIETDEERFARLSSLFGNVSDPGGDWALIHDLFEDASVRAQAVALTAPRARRPSADFVTSLEAASSHDRRSGLIER
jgi:hypothetical protein